MKVIGTYGDRFNLKYFIGLGMFGASLIFSLIGILGLFHQYSFVMFIILMGVNGAL